MILYVQSWIQEVLPEGQEGARQILGWALGLLDALDVLQLLKSVLWLLMIIAVTMVIFNIFGVGKRA